MRVLQLGKFYDPFVGGMETVLKEICESLVDQVEFQVIVANTRCRTEHENRKVPVTRVASLGKLFSCSLAPSFPLWARRFDPELIHVHLPNPLAELSALMADRDIPDGCAVPQRRGAAAQLAQDCTGHSWTLFTGARVASSCPRPDTLRFPGSFPNTGKSVALYLLAFRYPALSWMRPAIRRSDELRDGLPSVLCVGRLVTYKGVEFLIRALEGIKARLWIIGTGPLDGSLRNLAQEKRLADRVEFLGQVSDQDLVAYYHACDVFVLPSITNAEMFGVVQLEAMACRKPVISTNLPTGVSWVNQHGKTGYVVPPGNAEALAQSIQHLISNSQLREEMGEAGRMRVAEHFTSTKMAEAILQVYQEMLHQPCFAVAPANNRDLEAEEVVASSAE